MGGASRGSRRPREGLPGAPGGLPGLTQIMFFFKRPKLGNVEVDTTSSYPPAVMRRCCCPGAAPLPLPMRVAIHAQLGVLWVPYIWHPRPTNTGSPLSHRRVPCWLCPILCDTGGGTGTHNSHCTHPKTFGTAKCFTFCYTIVIPGWKWGFLAGFLPDSIRGSFKICLRPAFGRPEGRL